MPGYANPQNLNRYSYVTNNPLRYTDPTGHKVCDVEDGGGSCVDLGIVDSMPEVNKALKAYGVKLKGKWKYKYARAVLDGVEAVANAFNRTTPVESFTAVFGHIDFRWEGSPGMCGNIPAGGGGCTDGAHQIRFWSMSGHRLNDINRMIKNVVHELGHAFDWTHYDPVSKTRASNHMSGAFTRNTVLRPNQYAGRPDWQQSTDNTSSEIFADMFVAWTFNAWNTDTAIENVLAVNSAQTWMNGLVP